MIEEPISSPYLPSRAYIRLPPSSMIIVVESKFRRRLYYHCRCSYFVTYPIIEELEPAKIAHCEPVTGKLRENVLGNLKYLSHHCHQPQGAQVAIDCIFLTSRRLIFMIQHRNWCNGEDNWP